MIDALHAIARAKFGADIPAREHPLIRSREACIKSTRLAISLAKKHATRLHVCCTSPPPTSWRCSNPAR